jgi:hypothetical protein
MFKKCFLTAVSFGVLLSTPLFADDHSHNHDQSITKEEVIAAQQEWADGIVDISDVYVAEGDYRERARQHINELYAYEQGEVLFKPTLASEDQFRETFDEALSYFVGGEIDEDQGFAIKPWSNVRFGEQQIITDEDSALAMGNYFFTPVGSEEETKVEYTFGYIKDEDGQLRINAHHSSLPYSPSEE